jgi:glycosyltransferase involved in cell wall biosynthesis
MIVDILIPNYNGREALELCIESIAAYTSEAHRVIVYDDASTNPGERDYLVRAYGNGWIDKIVMGREHGGHGVALNRLVNDADSTTRHAVILDNDVQVLRAGWLSGLLGLVADPRVLIACTEKPTFGYCSRGYRPGMFLLWFGLLNMAAYRDGMTVDWSLVGARRQDEPWQTMFASIYPPENNPIFQRTQATWGNYKIDFDPEKVIFDPGCVLWCKMRHENPKGYIHQELTPHALSSFRHWGHAQTWLEPGNAETDKGRELRKSIPAELERLRGRT